MFCHKCTYEFINSSSMEGRGRGCGQGFLVVGTISKEKRTPEGQLWMGQYLLMLRYWPIYCTIWGDFNHSWRSAILGDPPFRTIEFWSVYGEIMFHLLKLLFFFLWLTCSCSIWFCFSVKGLGRWCFIYYVHWSSVLFSYDFQFDVRSSYMVFMCEKRTLNPIN